MKRTTKKSASKKTAKRKATKKVARKRRNPDSSIVINWKIHENNPYYVTIELREKGSNNYSVSTYDLHYPNHRNQLKGLLRLLGFLSVDDMEQLDNKDYKISESTWNQILYSSDLSK